MADALAALSRMNRHIAALSKAANSGRPKYLSVEDAEPAAKAIATTYFKLVRTELDSVKSRGGLVEEIDFVVQQILQLASARREKQSYVGQLNELNPLLLQASVDLMKSQGGPRIVISEIEKSILKTLNALGLPAAAAYEQALIDIARSSERISWRGTATELREALRDVIDHLAPDDEVSGAPGFQFGKGQTRPTQKQKVRYLLKARRNSSVAVSVAEGTLDTVEESVAALARSTYQRGSVSTHIGTTGAEIKNLKRYTDALLAELLEVS